MASSQHEVYVVDTHAIVWRFSDDPQLPARVHGLFDAVERGEHRLVVPTIILAELLSLMERRMPGLPLGRILETLRRYPSVHIAPFD
jgi:predicted nucleic acid-binding protein